MGARSLLGKQLQLHFGVSFMTAPVPSVQYNEVPSTASAWIAPEALLKSPTCRPPPRAIAQMWVPSVQ